jgi:hypothetical protein
MPLTLQDIHRLRAGFDSRTLPGVEFNHVAHIAVGALYVCELGSAAALAHLQRTIPAYNESQGGQNTDTSGYHETLTRFWVDRLAEFVATLPPELTSAERSLAAVEAFGTRSRLHEEYYTFDVVKSLEARTGWIAPDKESGLAARGKTGSFQAAIESA